MTWRSARFSNTLRAVSSHMTQAVSDASRSARGADRRLAPQIEQRAIVLAEALEACGIQNGMTLSTHHHFWNGDLVGNMLFDACGKLGKRDLTWFPSASFP